LFIHQCQRKFVEEIMHLVQGEIRHSDTVE
jgi:hypothetical protein